MRVKVTFHNYSNMFRAGVISRGDAWERRSIVKVFKIALWAALRTIIRPKSHQIAGFCIYNLKFFFRRWNPGLSQREGATPSRTHPRPQCLDPATNFRLARQRSRVHVLRNDRWFTARNSKTSTSFEIVTAQHWGVETPGPARDGFRSCVWLIKTAISL